MEGVLALFHLLLAPWHEATKQAQTVLAEGLTLQLDEVSPWMIVMLDSSCASM